MGNAEYMGTVTRISSFTAALIDIQNDEIIYLDVHCIRHGCYFC